MTKKELVKSIANNLGYTQKDISVVVDEVFNTILTTVASGEEVGLVGFGKFVSVDKQARDMRNPATGEIISVPAKKAPKFKPSSAFKDALN